MPFNMDQIWGIVRTILMGIVGYAVGKGLIPASIVPAELVGAIMTLIVALWSVFTKTNNATVSKAAAIVNVPAVEQEKVGITEPVRPSA